MIVHHISGKNLQNLRYEFCNLMPRILPLMPAWLQLLFDTNRGSKT